MPEPASIQEQFESRAQQEEADSLGIWTFLSTEILFFGGLILCYTIYRVSYHAGFVEASGHLYYSIGTINTFILLTSSLFMALAVHAIEDGAQKKLRRYLVLTFLFGAAFLGLKLCEYYLDYREHLVPSVNFNPAEYAHPQSAEMLFFLYFAMTGLHAIHMTIGLGALTYLYIRARREEFSTEYHSPVRVVGLYWHFVDIVWVFLYPMLYLINN
jgi:cytochrome c oxidase subunit 3